MEKTCNILNIEDDPDIGNMIRMILEYREYKVFLLERTDRVKELMKNNRIDIVLMDMLLSGTNGINTCIELKKDASLANIPLIMMSAHPDAEIICKSAVAMILFPNHLIWMSCFLKFLILQLLKLYLHNLV